MNTASKLAMVALKSMVLAAGAVAMEQASAADLVNLTEGQGSVISSGNPSWDGLSELVLIPGASLMGNLSTTTALYLGFTGGTTVDIDNMVLYTTPRNGSTVTRITHITLNGSRSPSIDLTSTAVCPVQPVSATNPCIVRLDTLTQTLETLHDYYFAVYFTLDTNNETIAGLGRTNAPGALSGFALYGDQTRIGANGALPTSENSGAAPFFLAYVTNE
jgi:hypothetical protein